jgi:hypothetical protein
MALDYFVGLENLSKYLVVIILAAFYLGQFSSRFPKKEK